MSRGYSMDLRERAIALVESGMSRRAAAGQLMVSASSSIRWLQRFAATGSCAEKPGRKARPSPLDDHADWLLALIAAEPDLTLAEIEVRLLEERQLRTTDSSISRFFQRHGVTYKKNAACERTASGRCRQGARRLEKAAADA